MNTPAVDHPITALMVEDEDELRAAIEASLSMFGIKVSGVGNAADFRARLSDGRFDLAIVDLGLPDDDGLSIVRSIAEEGPAAMGVIILTMAGETEDRIKGFASGADLYFAKPVDCRELAVAAIRLVQRMRKPPAPGEKAVGWTIRRSRRELESPSGATVNLTTKEMAFMETLAVGADATVARAHILNVLGYTDDEGGNRSLDALVRRLRIKADETQVGTLPIRTVHGVGYIFSAPLTAA